MNDWQMVALWGVVVLCVAFVGFTFMIAGYWWHVWRKMTRNDKARAGREMRTGK